MDNKNVKKNVILVCECFAYGTAKSIKQLCDFIKDDFNITVFYSHRDGTEEEIKDIVRDVTWIELKGKGAGRHLTNIMQIRAAIDNSTHVVHGHSSYGGAYTRLAAIGKRVPNVFYSPRAYAFLRGDLNWFMRRCFWAAEVMLASLGVTVSCGPAEYQIGRKISKRIVNINNAVAAFADTSASFSNRSSNKFEVVSVGRICHQKAFDVFLQTAAVMPTVRFTWVGSRDESYFENVVQHVGFVPENVCFIKHLAQPELFELISQSSLIFHPSRWEGLSRTLIESLALGVPIVTSQCPANLDCLTRTDTLQLTSTKQHESGLVEYDNGFACQSVADYVQAIRKLKDMPELAVQMGLSSLQLARDSYNVNLVKQQWLNLYHGQLQT